uniref:Uncharacterized protein n=1 Tax=Arundo donax TaxID=35708 RepID=A0A0A9A1Y7_ARUDO
MRHKRLCAQCSQSITLTSESIFHLCVLANGFMLMQRVCSLLSVRLDMLFQVDKE